ncbi:tyrosine-type recombinase/integrase, partial [Cohnella sp. GCM10020058]|uniref:tyrosine-type recombinase/integrase n=1 Tax=Cohnella sp. GCM10020058 TaxID=3317330 RepID=UPI003624F779
MAKKREEKLPPKVRKRSKGYTYRYSIPIINADGNPDRKQKETPQYATAQEAYDAGKIIEAELVKGTYVDEDNILFSDWAGIGLKLHADMSEIKDKGYRSQLSRLGNAKKYFKGKKLKDITRAEYEDFLLYLRDEKELSESSVKGTHASMRVVFNQAVRREIIGKDPTQGAHLPKYQETLDDLDSDPLPKYLEREQLLHVLRFARESAEQADNEDDAFERRQLYRAVFVLAYTGLRIGEFMALERRKWNRHENTISVTATLDSYGGPEKAKLGTPKNKASRRIVDVSESVALIIDEQIKDVTELRMRLGKDFYSESTFIFVRHKDHPGRQLSHIIFEKLFARLMKSCGYEGLTPHCLRHTFTSLSAEAGVLLEDVMNQLGHANDTMTKRVYLHITKPRRKANVAKLDALLKRQS